MKYSFPGKRYSAGSFGIVFILLIMFAGGITIAKLTNYWNGSTSEKIYVYHMMTERMAGKINR